jgi:hypothetical protein
MISNHILQFIIWPLPFTLEETVFMLQWFNFVAPGEENCLGINMVPPKQLLLFVSPVICLYCFRWNEVKHEGRILATADRSAVNELMTI